MSTKNKIWHAPLCTADDGDQCTCRACRSFAALSGYAADVLRQIKRVEEELNELVMTPGVEEPLAREAATIAEAFRNRRLALERMRHSSV